MTTHTNGLTFAQCEALDMLQEECAEVIKAISKIKRHGLDSYNPDIDDDVNNKEQLELEIADVVCMIQVCMDHKLLKTDIEATPLNKKLKWTHYIDY